MANLIISDGVTSVGNYSDIDIALTEVDPNINSLRTLNNGSWVSWTANAPEAFQGFASIKKGKGFVATSDGVATLPIGDGNLDINNVSFDTGLDFICLPYNDRVILDGLLPRIKSNSIKTYIDGSWLSWISNAPNGFQGFLTVNRMKGYVCEIEKVYDVFLDSNIRNNDTGVKIGTSYLNDTDNVSTNGAVFFTADSSFKSIDYPTVVINDTLPLIDLWINLNGTKKLIKYPTELSGMRFNIKVLNTTIIDLGDLTTATNTKDNGSIVDNSITIEDYGDLTDGYLAATMMYTGLFSPNVNNSENNPLVITDITAIDSMSILYDIKSISPTTKHNKMYVTLGTSKAVIEFADEYTDDAFIVIKNNIKYSGFFTKSNLFINL